MLLMQTDNYIMVGWFVFLAGLSPTSTYRIRIFTKTRSGTGKFSGWVEVTTIADAPPPPGKYFFIHKLSGKMSK